MTLTQAQEILHTLYQGDTDTPASTDDDYLTRTRLLNAAIGVWEFEGDGRWPELYTTLADAATGAKTTTSGDSTYDTPDDFKIMHGFVRVTDSNGMQAFYPEVAIDKAHLYANDTITKRFIVTGNPASGYTLNLLPAPSSTGLTINYEYYKIASALTTGADIIEMSDPYYAVYYALSVMFENDGEGDRAVKALEQANDRLSKMRLRLMVPGAYQFNGIPDADWDLGGGVFGV